MRKINVIDKYPGFLDKIKQIIQNKLYEDGISSIKIMSL